MDPVREKAGPPGYRIDRGGLSFRAQPFSLDEGWVFYLQAGGNWKGWVVHESLYVDLLPNHGFVPCHG